MWSIGMCPEFTVGFRMLEMEVQDELSASSVPTHVSDGTFPEVE